MQQTRQSHGDGGKNTTEAKEPEELLWISSASLLTAASSCNDVALQSNLYQYQDASTGETHNGLNEGELADLRRRLEAAKEDIDLAIDAIEEFDRQSN